MPKDRELESGEASELDRKMVESGNTDEPDFGDLEDRDPDDDGPENDPEPGDFEEPPVDEEQEETFADEATRTAYKVLKGKSGHFEPQKSGVIDLDTLRVNLSSIPRDTDKAKLVEELRSVFWALAGMDKAVADIFMTNDIGRRFDLKRDELKAFRTTVHDLRKRIEKARQEKAESDSEVELCAYFEELIEVVVDKDGKPAYMVKVGNGPEVKREHVKKDGTKVSPPEKKHFRWTLARAEKVKSHYKAQGSIDNELIDRKLFDDLVQYFKDVSDLPDENHYMFLAAWTMHTYLQEKFNYSPILYFHAEPGRGKTRTGKGLISVVWRGYHAETLNPAYLFRLSQLHKATIFFDVMDLWAKVTKASSEDILLSRYENGAGVARVLYPEKGPFKDTEFFDLFGPTIIATNEQIHEILSTRSIKITMRPSGRKFDKDVVPENGLELKERLVAFRARYLDKALEEIEKPAMGRLGDILRPILQIIRLVRPEFEGRFFEFMKMVAEEKRKEQSATLPVKTFRAVLASAHLVKNGILANMTIREAVNEKSRSEGVDERFFVSPHRIADTLESLGFKKAHTTEGNSAILWDQDLVKRLIEIYGE